MQNNQSAALRFGSVASGIEAASVAFNPLGWKAAWFSEIEAFPCKVLAHHFPSVPNLGDMTALPARILSGEVEAPDVLCGGTPCQAFSIAGLRKSLGDARGNLSLTFCEIANAIDTKRRESGKPPAVVLWENVFGCLSTDDNFFGCFLGALAGEDDPLEPAGGKWSNAGCVFGPERAIAWRVLDAKHFGLAQKRRRVIVVACPLEVAHPTAVLFELESAIGNSAQADSQAAEAEFPEPPDEVLDSCWWDGSQLSQTLDAVLYKKQCLPEKTRFPAVWDEGRLRFITPTECERLQGFPDAWTDIPGASDTARYKALGNSWPVPMIRWVGARIDEAVRQRSEFA